MGVEDWSTTASQNTSVGDVSISEGCSAKNINNGLRQMMADIKAWIEAYPNHLPTIVDSIDDITDESEDGFYYIKACSEAYPDYFPMIVDSIDDITEESMDGFYYIATDDIEE